MTLQFNIRVFLLILSVISTSIMISYALVKGRKNRTLLSFIWCIMLLFIWSTGQMLRMFSNNKETEWIFVRMEYFAICFIGASWLVFCLNYIDYKRIKSVKNIFLLVLPSIISYIAVLTNKSHHQFFTILDTSFNKFGIIFWFHTFFSYLFYIIGTIVLLKYSTEQPEPAKKQTGLLVVATVIPVIFNILLISGLINPGFDTTPICFTVSILLFGIAVFRYKLLNIVPIALRKVVDNISESIIIIDNANKIMDFNYSVKERLIEGIQRNDDISVLLKYLEENMVKTKEAHEIIDILKKTSNSDLCGEVTIIQEKKQKCFWVKIQPIIGVNKEVYGKLISFTDVSDYKDLLRQLHDKNLELETKNKMLEEYASTIQELAITKERNRLARDVHDTLGQTMTILITLLQLCKNNCRADPAKAEKQIAEAINIAGEGLKEIRRSISGMALEKIQDNNLINALNSLFNEFRSSGMKIDFTVKGVEGLISPEYSNVIYRICQEGLTNSLRHGKAKNVKIDFQLKNNGIFLNLQNDGIGSKKINKGFGLVGMEQRVRDLNGKISYGSEGEKGFYITVNIPINMKPDINQVDLDNNPGKNI